MEFNIKGACVCKNESWTWEITEGQITLSCLKCGAEAHFTLSHPIIDIYADVARMQEEVKP